MRRNDSATNFFLDKDGHLVSIQDDVIYTAYENDPDVPLSAHVLLGTSADIGSNPELLCDIDNDTCALDCTVSGYSYSCLASPGYQPDWRIAQAKAGAGPGCAEFTPVVVPPNPDNDGNTGISMSSSVGSISASSTGITTKSDNHSHATTTSITTHTTVEGASAKPSGASTSSTTGNVAVRTAAPVVVANAAIIVGIFAAL